jgi:hypothetical protein
MIGIELNTALGNAQLSHIYIFVIYLYKMMVFGKPMHFPFFYTLCI